MSIESLQQSVAANTAWINAVTTSSKLPAQLIELLSISNLNQKFTVQEGVLDAKVVDAPTLRGYKGNWAADSNSPLLSNTSGIVGDIYRVNIAGTVNIGSGSISYVVGDLIYRSATNWVKVSPNQISDITGLQSALDNLAGGLMAQGNWNALINSPDISGTTQTGYFWIVDIAGATDLGGITDWELNDWAVKTASGWAKIDNSDKVISVAGRTGVITLAMSDVSGLVSALATTVKITGDQSIAGLKTFSNTLSTAAINLSGSSAITIPNYIKHTGEATTNYFGFPGEKNFSVVTNSTTKLFASDTSAILYSLGNAKLTTQTYGVEVLGNIVNTGSDSTSGVVVSNPLSGNFFQSKLELRRVGVLGGVKIVSDRNNAGGVGLLIQVTANNTAETNGTYSTALSIGRDSIVGFTSVPIVGTRASGDNTTRAASTAFVTAATGAVPIGDYLPLTGGTLTGNLKISIPDLGGAPAVTAILDIYGYEGRGAGIKIRDSVNSATSPSNREWFVGTGYNTSNFNIGYNANGSQSSYAANTKFLVTTAGKVGIGTSTPLEKLVILDSDESLKDVLGVYNGVTGTSALNKGSAIRIGSTVNGQYSTKIATIYEGNNPGFLQPALAFFTMNNTYLKGSEVERMRISSNGDVGIGTTAPYKKLEVTGDLQLDANNANMWIKSGAAGTNGFINWTFSTNDTVYNKIGIDYDTRASTGFHIDTGYPLTLDCTGQINFKRGGAVLGTWSNVGLGIGATSPAFKLDIGTNLNSNTVFRINGLYSRVLLSGNVNAPTDGVGMWNFINHAGTNSLTRFYVQDANNLDSRLTFRFTGNGGSKEILSGSSTGKVGIGTTGPLATLHVNDVIPRIRLSSTTTATSDEATVGAIDFYTSDSSSEGQNVNAKIEGFSDDIYGRMGLRFFTGGEGYVDEKMRIAHGGNVGIGTTNPDPGTQLTLGTGSTGISFQSSVTTLNSGKIAVIKPVELGNGNGELVFETYKGGSGGGERMRIDNDGNVGIGATNPGTKLSLNGTTQDTNLGLSITNSDGANIHFRKKSGFNNALEIVNVNNDINIITGTNSRIYVDASTANVGIGTTTPGTKLHVLKATTSSSQQTILSITNDNSGDQSSAMTADIDFSLEDNNTITGVPQGRIGVLGSSVGSQASEAGGRLAFYTATAAYPTPTLTKRMVIEDSGNIGIGTGDNSISSSGARLQVIGGQNYRTLNLGQTQVNFSTKRSGITATHWNTTEQEVSMINVFSDSSNTVLTLGGGISTLNAVEDIRFFTALSNTTTTGTVRMTIKGNGYVGINEISPSYHLDVDGTIRATGDVIAYSDARVKENVVTIDNALDKVDKLRGVTYTRNDIEDKETKMGVIAQEVLKVIPEVVQKDKDGRYSVAYGNMNGLLIEAIKELKAEIEQLKSKI